MSSADAVGGDLLTSGVDVLMRARMRDDSLVRALNDDMTRWLRAAVENRKATAEGVPEEPPWRATDDRDDFSGDALVRYVTLRSADDTPMADDLRGHISGEGLRHVALNDPRDVIACCETELSLLDTYQGAVARQQAEVSYHLDWGAGERHRTPEMEGPEPKLIPGLRRAVELLAESYRTFPGWKEEWRS